MVLGEFKWMKLLGSSPSSTFSSSFSKKERHRSKSTGSDIRKKKETTESNAGREEGEMEEKGRRRRMGDESREQTNRTQIPISCLIDSMSVYLFLLWNGDQDKGKKEKGKEEKGKERKRKEKSHSTRPDFERNNSLLCRAGREVCRKRRTSSIASFCLSFCLSFFLFLFPFNFFTFQNNECFFCHRNSVALYLRMTSSSRFSNRSVFFLSLCSVLSLVQVAWFHKDRHTLLALQDKVITRNSRIRVSSQASKSFSLHIIDVQESDAGYYSCQVCVWSDSFCFALFSLSPLFSLSLFHFEFNSQSSLEDTRATISRPFTLDFPSFIGTSNIESEREREREEKERISEWGKVRKIVPDDDQMEMRFEIQEEEGEHEWLEILLFFSFFLTFCLISGGNYTQLHNWTSFTRRRKKGKVKERSIIIIVGNNSIENEEEGKNQSWKDEIVTHQSDSGGDSQDIETGQDERV